MNALPVPCATEAPFATNLGLREIRKEYPIFAVLQKGFDFIRYLEASFIEIPAPTKALGSARCVLPVCCQFYFGRLRITSVL